MLPEDFGRRVTSYDVAVAAGVSQPTVSRCFRPDSGISPTTRTRVLDAAERLGYMPNALARSLITQRSNLVAVIATRYTLRGNPDVAYALSESLRAAGKQLVLVTVERDFPSRDVLLRTLEYPLDGLISCALLTDTQLDELRARQVPVVLYNRTVDTVPVDYVTADHARACEKLARRLVAAGHCRFVCLAGPAEAWVSRQRMQGFLRGLQVHGIEPQALLETDFSYQSGRDAMLAHASVAERPDAVLCANDQVAFGAMDACRFDLGWRIPADVSIVGFDDVAEAHRPSYDLTTVHQQSIEMAQEAVRLLMQRLARPAGEPVHTLLKSSLVQRGSARL